MEKELQNSKSFLNNVPVPRSSRMVDRLGIKNETIQGRGKFFGADEYMGITAISAFLILFFIGIIRDNTYANMKFENLRKDNINKVVSENSERKKRALEVSDDEISFAEQQVMKSKEFKEYLADNDKSISEKLDLDNDNEYKNIKFNSNIPKFDIKDKFKQSLS